MRSADRKILLLKWRRRGEKQSAGLFFGGEPSPGVPVDLLLLCILPDDIYFFYKLRPLLHEGAFEIIETVL